MLTKDRIFEIFGAFTQLKVLIIGDVMIDSYIWGNVKRLSPEAPVPIVNVSKRENRLGGAANVAKNIKSLGAIPILCSCIGADDKSDIFFNLLNEEHMPSHGIITSKERLTTVKFRVIGNNTHLLRVDEETDADLTKDESKQLYERIENILHKEKIDVIIFEDYDKGTISEKLISDTTQLALSLNIPIVVDPKKKNFLKYNNVSLFKPNFNEFCEGIKLEIGKDDEATLTSEMKKFQQAHNIETILVSLSERGVIVSAKDNDCFSCMRVPAHVRKIADVSGAGDTLISVAALCTALKLEPQVLAVLSNLSGGVVCEHVGVVPVDKDKLLNEALKVLIR